MDKEKPDRTDLEARCLELFRQSELGQLISMWQVLEDFEKEEAEALGEGDGNALSP